MVAHIWLLFFLYCMFNMSTPETPFVDEVQLQSREDCPLRELSEAQLCEMARGEEPYYLVDKLVEASGVAADQSSVVEGMEYVYGDLSFSRNASKRYASPGLTYFEERQGIVYAPRPSWDVLQIDCCRLALNMM
jgi:hypothetical protein